VKKILQPLYIEFKDNLKNHLGTFHAGAQFALAEACSGLSLQKHFPDSETRMLLDYLSFT
jgi:acyl-coenzyme A thioesterase PaaI-like protein